MSDPIRVAFVTEGPTDHVVLLAAVRALLDGRDFEPIVLSPQLDTNLRAKTEGGWGSVYKWCRQVVDQAGGNANENPVFEMNDIVVIQVDADVARMSYADYDIAGAPTDLPCEQACPPARATTDALREVMLGWLGTGAEPPHVVLCTPSKNLETWVLVSLFPKRGVECAWGLEQKLRKHGLMRGKQKLIDAYKKHTRALQDAWPDVTKQCGEAERFSADFTALVP